MKIISILLSLCLSFNVMASGLEDAFQQYHYALTVEWDQKDQQFQQEQTQLFLEKLSTLFSQGMSKNEVEHFILSHVSDQQVLQELKQQMQGLAYNADSSAELAHLLTLHTHEFYSQGASWHASRGVQITLIAAISVFFAYSVFFTIKYGCIQKEDGVTSYCNG